MTELQSVGEGDGIFIVKQRTGFVLDPFRDRVIIAFLSLRNHRAAFEAVSCVSRKHRSHQFASQIQHLDEVWILF
jgi:hypothetical protein